MASKAIKLYDGSTYLLPVTLASLVQYSAGSNKISVQEAIQSVVSAELSNGHNSIITTSSSGTSTAVVTAGNYAYLNTLTRQGDAITSSIGIKGGGDISITYSSTDGLVISSNVSSSLGRVVNAYLAVVDSATSTTPIVSNDEIEYTSGIPLSTLNVTQFGGSTVVSGNPFYLKCGDNIKYSYSSRNGLKITASDSKVKQSSNANNEKHYLLSKYTANSSTEETSYTVFNTNAYINPAAAYLYTKYAYATEIKEGGSKLEDKYAAKAHTHTINLSNSTKQTLNGDSVNVLVGTSSSVTPGSSSVTLTYYTYAMPTKQYVDAQIGSLANALKYKGTIAANATAFPSSASQGDVYIFAGDATISGKQYEKGDAAIYDGTNWNVVNTNWSVDNKNQTIYKTSTTLATIGGVNITANIPEELVTAVNEFTHIDNNHIIVGSDEEGTRDVIESSYSFVSDTSEVISNDDKANRVPTYNVVESMISDNTDNTAIIKLSGTQGKTNDTSTVQVTNPYINVHPTAVASGASNIQISGSGSGTGKASVVIQGTPSTGKITLQVSYTNSAKAKIASKDGNNVYAYISPTGANDATNGNVLIFKQGSNVTLTADSANNTLEIASSYTNDAKLVLNGVSTNSADTAKNGATTNASTNAVYMHSYTTTQTGTDAPIKIVGQKGVQVYSNNGKELRVTHAFTEQSVIKTVTLTKLTYYESTNTVDDFVLDGIFSSTATAKNIASITTETSTAYVKTA